ncbi:MAG: SDR family oxidoreductase [Cryomorphaceae bacterium]|nr:SDR family oxidoreductase [Cryomorphaceae bacterium]
MKKTALITGGTKGIGLGIAEVLIKAGYNVCITGRKQSDAERAAEKLNSIRDGAAYGFESDVRKLQSQISSVKNCIERFGQLNLFVANAGVGYFAPIEEMDPEKWKETIDTNLTGVFNSVKASWEALEKTKGYFISIASLAGTNFFAKGSAYNASKFGVVGFTQSIMLDLRKRGIRVSTIMPGSVTSHFNQHTPDAEKDAWKIQPEDIGQMIVHLMDMHPRALPSKIEIRPTMPPSAT